MTGTRVVLAVAAAALVVLGVQLGRGVPAPVDGDVERTVWAEGRVRVEVLNAGGVSGMARAATFQLRGAGFDVVDFRNADGWDPEEPELESVVFDRVGRSDAAQAVAAELGIDNVQSDPDPNLYVDVTVVLGSRWAEGGSGPGIQKPGAARPGWDPRGWFGR